MDDDDIPSFKKNKKEEKEDEEEIVDFVPVVEERVEEDLGDKIDRVINNKNHNNIGGGPSFKPIKGKEKNDFDKKFKTSSSRVSFAHDIKKNPPEPGFMKVEVKPAIYSLDLNIDAHWWFTHVCTVFPLLLDQAKRTHIDIKDSFKPEKRLPDFPYMFIFVAVMGIIVMFAVTKFFGWW